MTLKCLYPEAIDNEQMRRLIELGAAAEPKLFDLLPGLRQLDEACRATDQKTWGRKPPKALRKFADWLWEVLPVDAKLLFYLGYATEGAVYLSGIAQRLSGLGAVTRALEGKLTEFITEMHFLVPSKENREPRNGHGGTS